MKTKNLFCTISFFSSLISFAQSPNCQWVKKISGNGSEYIYSATIPNGGTDVVVVGSFNSPTLTLGSINLINAGNHDMFIAKYDGSGNVLWAKSTGGNKLDYAKSVVSDSSGNILVTGGFESDSINFGSTTLFNKMNDMTEDVFIVKYNSSGNLLWAKSLGGKKSDYSGNISMCQNGTDFLLVGTFKSDSINFGSYTLANSMADGSEEMFLSKYNSSGNVLWAKRFGGSKNDGSADVTTDVNDDIIVGGYFDSPSIVIGTTTLTNAGGNNDDMFLAKFSSSGTAIWAKRMGGANIDLMFTIAIPKGGTDIYCGGYFRSSSITLGSIILTNFSTDDDLFFAKYDASGNAIWAKSAGGSSGDYVDDISLAPDGSGIFVTGSFYSSSIIFGSTTFTNLGTGLSDDTYLAKYDTLGNMIWVKVIGGTSYDVPVSIAIPESGTDVVLAGVFWSPTIAFGTSTLTNASANNSDAYLAKFGAVTGIAENIVENNLIAYPNPTKGIFNLSYKTRSTEDFEIFVFNTIGEVVYKATVKNQKTGNEQFKIDLSNKPKGAYLLQLRSSENVDHQKIIKE